jgi:hypothetical protein
MILSFKNYLHSSRLRVRKNKEELEYRNREALSEDMPGKSLFCRKPPGQN